MSLVIWEKGEWKVNVGKFYDDEGELDRVILYSDEEADVDLLKDMSNLQSAATIIRRDKVDQFSCYGMLTSGNFEMDSTFLEFQ